MVDQNRWVLNQVQLRSFLGVGPGGVTVTLDRPVIVLHGLSGSGKTTIISGIEWALFGSIEAAADYSVAGVGDNVSTHRSVIHDGEGNAEVILTFQRLKKTLIWKRYRNSVKPRPIDDEVSCLIDGTEVLADPKEVFGISHTIYSRGISPSQTTIRNLVHNEKKERNEALDSLFGIETLNNLSVGFSGGSQIIRSRVQNLIQRYEDLSSGLRAPIKTQFEKRAKTRQAVIATGLSKDKLTDEAAYEAVHNISHGLGDEVKVEGRTLEELQTLVVNLLENADKAWANPGPQERMKRLTDVHNKVPPLRSSWQESLEAERIAQEKLNELVNEIGDEQAAGEAVSQAIEKLDEAELALADANRKAAVLYQAKEWLNEHDHDSDLSCPVCQREIGAADLLAAMEASLELLQGSDGAIARLQGQIREAREEKKLSDTNLERLIAVAKKVKSSATEMQEARKKLIGLVSTIVDNWQAIPKLDEQENATYELLQSVSKASSEPPDKDDELDILARRLISETEEARNGTAKELDVAGKRVEGIRSRIVSTQRLLEFLQEDQTLSDMDAILSDNNLSATAAGITEVMRMSKTVQRLAELAGDISLAEAEKVTESVSAPVKEWFGRISRHDLLKGAIIETRVTRAGGRIRNSYEIRATDASLSNPIPAGNNLSGGYEMVLAVSALCAMQEQVSQNHGLGLFILDEPTESLDPELAEAMGKSLGLHAPGPRTIVITNQLYFAQAIQDSAGAARAKVINLERWTKSSGTKLEVAGDK